MDYPICSIVESYRRINDKNIENCAVFLKRYSVIQKKVAQESKWFYDTIYNPAGNIFM